MYTAKNFDHLLGTPGFSDQLLKNHFTLYQGYVTNTNKLADDLASAEKAGWVGTPGYAELKRRMGWEFNGMRLHEYYFGNMTKQPTVRSSEFGERVAKDFGSYEAWEKDFRAVGAMRGIGWAILYLDKEVDRFFNVWINEHDVGHLATCTPILVIDVFEHAFMIDYGVKRADYIETVFKAINWTEVEKLVGD